MKPEATDLIERHNHRLDELADATTRVEYLRPELEESRGNLEKARADLKVSVEQRHLDEVLLEMSDRVKVAQIKFDAIQLQFEERETARASAQRAADEAGALREQARLEEQAAVERAEAIADAVFELKSARETECKINGLIEKGIAAIAQNIERLSARYGERPGAMNASADAAAKLRALDPNHSAIAEYDAATRERATIKSMGADIERIVALAQSARAIASLLDRGLDDVAGRYEAACAASGTSPAANGGRLAGVLFNLLAIERFVAASGLDWLKAPTFSKPDYMERVANSLALNFPGVSGPAALAAFLNDVPKSEIAARARSYMIDEELEDIGRRVDSVKGLVTKARMAGGELRRRRELDRPDAEREVKLRAILSDASAFARDEIKRSGGRAARIPLHFGGPATESAAGDTLIEQIEFVLKADRVDLPALETLPHPGELTAEKAAHLAQELQPIMRATDNGRPPLVERARHAAKELLWRRENGCRDEARESHLRATIGSAAAFLRPLVFEGMRRPGTQRYPLGAGLNATECAGGGTVDERIASILKCTVADLSHVDANEAAAAE